MNSPKVKTQKTLSALLGVALAAVVLLQASNIQSKESIPTLISMEEAALIADVEQMFLEEDVEFEEEIFFEESISEVKVFNSNNELIAEGDTKEDADLRALVNKADKLVITGDTEYYKIS